eukprot:scaffold5781_cov124-Isochrysis_galbana.AAC.18
MQGQPSCPSKAGRSRPVEAVAIGVPTSRSPRAGDGAGIVACTIFFSSASGETANAEQQWIWRGRTASVCVNARDGGRTAKAIVSGKRSSMIVRPHGGIPRQE